MIDIRIDNFIRECSTLGGAISLDYEPLAPSIRFSNSGRRGLKYFSISLADLITSFEDMRNNIAEYAAAPRYSQDTHRTLFYSFSSPTASALGGTQTMPFFNLLAKIIHVANQLDTNFSENTMLVNLQSINNTLDYLQSQLPDNKRYLNSLIDMKVTPSINKLGSNIIYYGAPGTGKSHTIDGEISERNAVRTVFHADTTNSDFMGSLKPKMNGASIEYEFRPGPFTTSVINAIKDPIHHHWLIIEEINRAPAAAVFGEIFQLLDRESGTGTSRYSITLSDLDMLSFIESETGIVLTDGKLRLPGNLSLLATMNSSDQAVMPLDTAFKRRWQFRYIPLDFDVSYKGGEPCANGNLNILNSTGGKIQVSWKAFAKVINEILTDEDIAEDRHLGPFFLSDDELKKNPDEALTGKLFMYLWDDVLRHGLKDAVFDSATKTYGQLTRKYHNNEKIFSERFYELLKYNDNSQVTSLQAVAEGIPDYGNEE
ncbi:MAG: type II restriction endonuclease subunit R [Gammaproteobacteria bacterium]|nr:MAG: type II restriction endonuclease subunit R [Gammaproteobacteria bacterium]